MPSSNIDINDLDIELIRIKSTILFYNINCNLIDLFYDDKIIKT